MLQAAEAQFWVSHRTQQKPKETDVREHDETNLLDSTGKKH